MTEPDRQATTPASDRCVHGVDCFRPTQDEADRQRKHEGDNHELSDAESRMGSTT